MTVYQNILDELASGQLAPLQRSIFLALRRAYPQGISRAQLVQITGESDRKNRRVIATMRSLSIPIVATSREAGYRLDVSEAALDAMDAELASREQRIHEQRQALGRTKQKVIEMGINAIPAQMPRTERATQPRLIGG